MAFDKANKITYHKMELPYLLGVLMTYSFLISLGLLLGSASLVEKTNSKPDSEGVSSDFIEFPKGFFKGVARSFYQDGGHNQWASRSERTTSNWQWFENHAVRVNARGISLTQRSPIKDGQLIGSSSDGWKRAFEDISLLKQLGCNAQRFSIEWAEIETAEGVFNEEALSFYEKYCDALLANNITPMVTLHHFVHPYWFEKRGGFAKEENISYFVRYSQVVFERLSNRVTWWGTINEPTVLSACGYILGIHPPGKIFDFNKAGLVLKHLLQAHVAVYKALKSMPHGDRAQVGLIHQALCFEPYKYALTGNYKFLDPVGFSVAKFFNFSFAHKQVKRFLAEGIFSFQFMPGMRGIEYTDEDAPHSYDFIGLNFYSKVILSGSGPTHYDHQVKTDMDYAMYPEALYAAIQDLSDLKKPIYITETGIADGRDDRREKFIKSYMSVIHRAVHDGYDVRGVFYWSLLDNYEWNDGFDMKFGLFHVDPQTKQRTLRAGATAYRDYVRIKPEQELLR